MTNRHRRGARRIHGWAAPAVAALMLVGCGAPAPPPSATTPATPAAPSGDPAPSVPASATGWWEPTGETQVLATGLAAPWSVVPLPEGGALISQRDDGRVLELTAFDQTREVGVVPDVVSGGEAGLHGLAVWQDEATWLYAYHGTADDNRVVRMPLTGAPGALGLGEAEPVITGIPRARTHNGGRIAFGPDGFLYVATGDAQLRDAAQDPASLAGKILRLTATGDAAPGNPFGSAVWSIGHRNVQGIAWTSDGVLWASEFGQDTWDELNVIVPGGNYGWPETEGIAGVGGLIDPVLQFSPAEASPSGLAAIGDTVFVAGLRGQRVWVVDTADGEVRSSDAVFEGELGRIRDVVDGADGSLWLLTNNTDGRGDPRPDDDQLVRAPLATAP
ncbi:sorbosone dehydrogenase family protein [Microbacterium sp. 18062]|uniref:PQQ-dependent sugar dehydrogenase n=1 Tax=Microbacterium sp. 18062 TaxID=2681410 RepID=UPI001358A253|nr:PQQ-dependent sugar dehydrogenase [Microbacterium sp. 18062]